MTTKVTKIICIVFLCATLAIGILPARLLAVTNTSTNSAQVKPATVNLTGIIKKIAVEGTCYQLVADDGQKYELMGKFPKTDGTRVQISGVVKIDMATICQVGKPLQVKAARVVK
jgi:hypothetical protein